MLELAPSPANGRAPTFLFIGAHSDDIEIGCGGTAMQLARAYPRAKFLWVVLGASGARVAEAKRGARFALGAKADATVVVEGFRDGFFPADFAAIKGFFETLKQLPAPDVIFTHQREDLHQDHRVTSELTWNTFRNQLILEYEIPKWDGGLGSPSCFVPLSAATLRRKTALLMKVYATQRARRWFTASTFEGLARLRGIECNAPDGYAEAFYARKFVLGTSGGMK